MRRIILFTPCRVSFALCLICAWAVDPERTSDIAFSEPPRVVVHILPQPQGSI
jgi:hypothetical protein